MTRIKICGITNKEDALAAAELGADAIGFVLYPKSPRFVDPTRVAEILAILPPFITPVGVFVDEEEQQIRQVLRKCGLRVLQLHGDEKPASCKVFREKVIKAFRIGGTRGEDQASLLKKFPDYPVDVFLLDTYSEQRPGGTGLSFDWQVAAEAREALQKINPCGKIILSGGLTPENVGEAIRRVRPYAVDVSSGVESAPGRKDIEKMRAFIQAVRRP